MQRAIDSAKENHGKIDWSGVSKAIAASEPPRIADIPAHVSFLQKWGGSPTKQHLIMQTLSYLELEMHGDRIVSGSFLGKLASLKLAPAELMPYMVHACVIANAIGDKERENVGCTVTEAHVKSLAGNNKKDALKANDMLKNAYEIYSQASGHDKTRCLKQIGKFSLEICKHIFNLGSDYDSLDNISEAFVDNVFAPPQNASSSSASGSAATVAEDEPPSNALNFASDGTNDAGRMTVINSGFKVGCVVEPKKLETDVDEQYELQYINDDGSVGVYAIQADGKNDVTALKVFKFDDLVQKYKVVKNRIELVDGYPDTNHVTHSDKMEEVKHKGALAYALNTLYDGKGYKTVEFRCQKKPKERLFCLTEALAGKVRLVPVTAKAAEPTETVPMKSVVVKIGASKYQLNSMGLECVSEFFFMRVVHEKKNANMLLEQFSIDAPVSSSEKVHVTVPCAVNSGAIAKGEELVLYKPAPKAKAGARPVNVAMEPPIKKPKTDDDQ